MATKRSATKKAKAKRPAAKTATQSGSKHKHDYRPPRHDRSDPCQDVDYNHPHDDHPRKPPPNDRYPDPRIYGSYASKSPPRYIPHPYDHSCFKPRKDDCKPPYECEGRPDSQLCLRRNSRSLTADQQNRFLNAFTQANALAALGPIVDIHANAIHNMHGNPRFLPWHRVYLLRFEALLQMIDPTVCIPYWKSSADQAFPSWLVGFTPTVNLTPGPHTVTRQIGVFANLPNVGAVTTALGNATFNPFAGALEGIHNSGHVWVGGSMMSVPSAPCDPIFWMHHCEIDRIWAEWQATHPGQNPALAGVASTMDPWTETEVDTRDIAALGYAYV